MDYDEYKRRAIELFRGTALGRKGGGKTWRRAPKATEEQWQAMAECILYVRERDDCDIAYPITAAVDPPEVTHGQE